MLDSKKVLCIVPDDELTGAIGKVGENVSLAVALTGLDIEIKGRTEYHKDKESNRRKKIKVGKLSISSHIKKLLKDAGYKNAQDIMSHSKEKLMEAKGLGSKSVDKIYTAIHKVMSSDQINA